MPQTQNDIIGKIIYILLYLILNMTNTKDWQILKWQIEMQMPKEMK